VKAKATFSAPACRAGRPAAALLAAALAGCAHDRHSGRDAHGVSPPARPILRAVTHGPKFHWFGYYDLQPFDPSQRYLLGMEVDFERRSPTADDAVRIGMVDLQDGDRWIELGESRAWCWQQGCRLQWRPGSRREAVWNDRRDGRFVCRVVDVVTRQERVLPYPIYDLSPDGRFGLGTDFARLGELRPGYGYAGAADVGRGSPAPENSGIYVMDMDSGAHRLLFSLADVARMQYGGRRPLRRLCFNHIKWSPDGARFLFFCHEAGRYGRMYAYTADADGGGIRLLAERPAHYAWQDRRNALIHSRGAFRLYRDDGSGFSRAVWRRADGHPSYLPGLPWIVADSYPRGANREEILSLFHVPCGRTIELGRLRSPPQYDGEWRCDAHPRVSPDGERIAFDSIHAGNGRQIYVMDIRSVVASHGD